VALALVALAGATPDAMLAGPSTGAEYEAQFLLELRSGEPSAAARIRIIQPERRLKRLRLNMPEDRYRQVSGAGRVQRKGDTVTWDVPATGGELRYEVQIDHKRNDKGYDALVTRHWALMRLDDAFPPAAATLRKGARSRSEVLLDLPPGWSALTAYLPDPEGRLAVEHRERRHARPVGWMIAGRIGARMDEIGPTTVRVAAPRGQSVQRVPMLALVRATLPVLQAEIPGIPAYLLILSADDPMWRGGLSAPNSLFLHASRPLISENGTSTLVHEMLHVVAPIPSRRDHDWIDEGIAEYLGLVALLRGRVISEERFDHAIATFRRRGADVDNMLTPVASGVITARAVAIFHDLDVELRRRSPDGSDIFDLVRHMMEEKQPIDIIRLRELASTLIGGAKVAALAPARVPEKP
jgi:hypothetical protein